MPAVDARKDYYALLQLRRPRSLLHPSFVPGTQAEPAAELIFMKDVKSAYYRLAKLFHPDKTGGDEQAAEHFKKVLEAYEVLSDPVTRQQYHGLRAQVMSAQEAADAAMAAQRAQAFRATQDSEDGAWNLRRARASGNLGQAEEREKARTEGNPTYRAYANGRPWQPTPEHRGPPAEPEKQKRRPQHQKAKAERPGEQSATQDSSLIRSEQVSRLAHLNHVQKNHYESLVRQCWSALNIQQRGGRKYNEAYETLLRTSQILMQGMKHYQQAQPDKAQAESCRYRPREEYSQWSHMTPEDFAPPPPPPRPEEPRPSPPEPTPEYPENFDFSIFTFDHYFDSKFREKPFLRLLRANIDEGKHEVRKAQVALTVARVNLQKFGASYVRTLESIRYEAELRERETWEIWWKEELARRERWLKAHEDMAKLRRRVERIRIIKERQAEEARMRVVEQERENVKMKAQGGKVEVIELDDSDDESLFDGGAPFDPTQEDDELLGDTTIGSGL